MQSLSVIYRPTEWEDCLGQSSIIKILKQQLLNKKYSNCYLFTGPSGVGKTTLARILANKINNNVGSAIEIDGASNNGVDQVRAIIEDAKERSLVSPYKIYVIDECHAITSQGWQAFLKCLEEPPAHTIFIFCTTNIEKVPETIQNRCMRFNFNRVSISEIENKLKDICLNEGIKPDTESLNYISKLANGSVREAIATLEKCLDYNMDLNINNVLECLGNFSHKTLFKLTNAIIDNDEKNILLTTNEIFKNSSSLVRFVDYYFTFILDLSKYCLFKNTEIINIPSCYKEDLDYTTSIEDGSKYFTWLANKLLDLKLLLKQDTTGRDTLDLSLINMSRGN